MKVTMPGKAASQPDSEAALPVKWGKSWAWLYYWEIYLIVLVAAFLRLYRINTTEFDDDQANIFRMAHDAVSHGFLVATANPASIGNNNPPGVIYLLMIPAALSANPLWAAVMTALLAVIGVLLTYVMVRRLYGRVAATIASLTFATAWMPVFYSRFIWNQNYLLFFVPLFIFILYQGAFERRKGWLFPAIPLLGFLFQLHGSGALLAAPLLATVFLAPGTIRWRDIISGVIALFVIYAPFLVWEVHAHFADVTILLDASKRPSVIDNQALLFYQLMISPFSAPFSNWRSLMVPYLHIFTKLIPVMTALVIGGAVLALLNIVWYRSGLERGTELVRNKLTQIWQGAMRWWQALRASPYRSSLFVLLVWQIVPLADLLHHSIKLYAHYFIIFMPGPFILVGFLLAKAVEWCRRYGRWGKLVSYGVYGLAALLISLQFLGSALSVLDAARGNFIDSNGYAYSNDLNSLQQALHNADQVAQEHHLNRVYISVDRSIRSAMRYLSQQMSTPVTVFDDTCLVLPDPAQGPAVILTNPYNGFMSAMVQRFGHATLVAQPERLGGPPFNLYIVSTTAASPLVGKTFTDNLQLLGTQSFSYQNANWQVTSWRDMRSMPVSYRTTYTYTMVNDPLPGLDGSGDGRQCVFSSMRTGDQLLVPFHEMSNGRKTMYIGGNYFAMGPDDVKLSIAGLSPITFETYSFKYIGVRVLGSPNSYNDEYMSVDSSS